MSSIDLNNISAWQYHLPEQLIASRPSKNRDDSRLMVVRRQTGQIEHRQIRELPDLLSAHDRLVFNNTKVVPGRLFGFRTATKGKWEGLFLQEQPDLRWKITGQTRGRLQAGETLTIVPAAQADAETDGVYSTPDNPLLLTLDEQSEDGSWLVTPNSSAAAFDLLDTFGTLPLPPYIGRKVADAADNDRYQTVFANQPGAIAAPTAGLHFTTDLLQRCRQNEIARSEVTLHVGIGTFRPVSAERLSDHQMHAEWCQVTPTAAAEIKQTIAAGNNIVAVGTTSVRTLEASAIDESDNGWSGSTNLFITPGFQFRFVSQLLTNFHLPGSTLIVLVAALAGYELTMEAYRKAVEQQYRFYSYGDAMLML